MNGDQVRKAFFIQLIQVVVQFHRANNRLGQSPKPEQIAADVRVGRAENLLFDLVNRNFLVARLADDAFVFLVSVRGQNQFSNVVQQSGNEALLCFVKLKSFFLGDDSSADGSI